MSTYDGSVFGEEQPCFGCAPRHPIGLKLRFTRETDAVTTTFTPGEHHQGPPGIFHGGLVSTLADELAAWTVFLLTGKFGFTTSISLRLPRAARIGTPVAGTGRLLSPARRMVDVGVVLSQGGQEVCEGSLRFALLDKAAAEKLLGRPLPEEWISLTRG